MVAIALSFCACDDDEDPVDVPFEGLEVPAGDEKKPPPAPPPTATETAAPKPAPRPPAASKIGGCCSALRSSSAAARDEGGKRMYDQAAKLCSGLMVKATRGEITESQALSQVRSSLLGPAPSACR